MKKRIGVFFGGKSGEHEVSRVSATTVINNLDREKYDVVTIGITKQGEWLLYEGPIELIAPGAWEQNAREDLERDRRLIGQKDILYLHNISPCWLYYLCLLIISK